METELQFQGSIFFSYLSRLKNKVKWWANHYIHFSKPALFLTENAVLCQLILVLNQSFEKEDLRKSAAIVNLQEGLTAILGFMAAHLTPTASARFKMVFFTGACYILGLVLLSVSQKWQFVYVFYPSLVLLTLGKLGKNPPLKLLLAEQLVDNRTNNQSNKKIFDPHVKIRTEVWWRVVKFSGAAFSAFSSDSIYAPPIVMAVGYLMFVSGTYFCKYNMTTKVESLLSMVCKVVMEALRKRKLDSPALTSTGELDNEANKPSFSPDIRILRWIDKAVVVRRQPPLDRHNSQNNDCKVTVAEVKYTKRLLLLIPVWICVFMYSLIQATESTFFVEQSYSMEHIAAFSIIEIDIAFIFLIQSITSSTISFLVDVLIPEDLRPELRKRATLVRIGVGLALCICCSVVAWKVEVYRLQLVQLTKEMGLYDYGSNPSSNLPMRTWWMVPQYLLLGLMEGLVEDGLGVLFNLAVEEQMEFLEKPFNDFIVGMGKFLTVFYVMGLRGWVCSRIDDSRLDKYFKLLAILSSVNVGVFCVFACIYATFSSSDVGENQPRLTALQNAFLRYKSKEPPEEDEPKKDEEDESGDGEASAKQKQKQEPNFNPFSESDE